MSIVIRKAEIKDAEAIHHAHMSSIIEICSKDHTEEEINVLGRRPYKEEQRHNAILNNIVYVVELENCIEGFIHFEIFQDKKDVYVYGLYLTGKVQRLGVARKFINILFDKCKENNIETIKLSSTLTAHNFYQKMGFIDNGLLGHVLLGQIKVQCYPMTKVFSNRSIELKVLSRSEENEKLVQDVLANSPKYYLAISGELPKANEGKLFFEEAPLGFSKNKIAIGIYFHNKLIGVNDNLFSYPDDDTIYLGLLILIEDFKNRGFGGECYLLIEKIFKTNIQYKKIILSVVQTNENAFKFWEKVGFKRTGVTKPYEVGDFKTIVAMMEKRINE